MIKIIIEDGFYGAGVYKIQFSDGRFYIGSTYCALSRLQLHRSSILNNFSTASTCKSLKVMKDFDGSATFQMLERLEYDRNKRLSARREIYLRESEYIIENAADLKMLNITGHAFRRQFHQV